ncbi:MAG: penicillin acylase family protein [Bacteroidetes bacterium]|nr:penicillin acylase family protein [Bacteroidota bacterium]
MYKIFLLLLLPLFTGAQSFSPAEISRWEKQAKQVTIIRDQYGIPHIYGKTDADAVFGLLYAQCEDDFPRVEMNYIEKLGRMSEVKGENELYNDLLIRLVINQEEAKADYARSPLWLKKLCIAFADAVNYYIAKHPEKKPALLQRFEPWYPMLWTDGSIGAISTADVSVNELKQFYSAPAQAAIPLEKDPSVLTASTFVPDEDLTGSNGFAFSPSITESRNAILYINPHVTFYFRPEVHVVSEEGLNVYGAVTWGQFFVYQGFNAHCGWMHTSSAVDAADTYIEKINCNGNSCTYQYEGQQRKLTERDIRISYRTAAGTLDTKTIHAYFTHHGPVMAQRKTGEWISMKADNRILNGLIQCWQRNKARSFADFKKTLDLRGNISNNTVYADAEGNIAYWHGNRVPVRNTRFDWNRPVDGSLKATEWKGYHSIGETLQSVNPVNGWLQNCNSTPYTVAGSNSPKKEKYPAYMAPDGENFRGINAVRVLSEEQNYTIDKVIRAGYDTRLAAFEVLVPGLIKAYDQSVKPGDSLFAWLSGPIAHLKKWDYRCGENSVATALAIHWGEKLLPKIAASGDQDEFEFVDQVTRTQRFVQKATPEDLLQPLLTSINELQQKFGTWEISWGHINRFQRISSDIEHRFDDLAPSIPVGFASSAWGMLPSYTSRSFPGTKKRYGVNGNSFICAVEFGKRIRAKSLLAGGESGDMNSPHFFDQGEMYSKGQFKEVLFYKDEVLKHAVKTYHPGQL